MDYPDRLRIDPAFEERRDSFHADLLREDELGMVISAHLHIERELKLFIEAAVPSPGRFRKLTYDKTLSVALEHGLESDLEKSLRAIGSLRNRFGHRLGTSVDAAETEKIYATFGSAAKQIVDDSYARTRAKLGPEERPESIKLLDPKEQCAFYFVTLWSSIVAQTHSYLRRGR